MKESSRAVFNNTEELVKSDGLSNTEEVINDLKESFKPSQTTS